MTWINPREQVQFIVVARRPDGWQVPDYEHENHGRWCGLRNQLKSIQKQRIAGTIVGGEVAARSAVTLCHNLGLEAEYAKLEDVLQ